MNKLFSLAGSLFSRFKYGERLNPVRDWLVLITFSSIALAGIIVWNLWIFDTVEQGGTIGSESASSSTVFDRDSLDAIVSVFTNRATEEAKYKTGVYQFADPSQ